MSILRVLRVDKLYTHS